MNLPDREIPSKINNETSVYRVSGDLFKFFILPLSCIIIPLDDKQTTARCEMHTDYYSLEVIDVMTVSRRKFERFVYRGYSENSVY